MAAPHLYGGAVATVEALAENRWVIRCGLEMLRCPRTVLCKGVATPVRRAREPQARERGRPRQPSATLAA